MATSTAAWPGFGGRRARMLYGSDDEILTVAARSFCCLHAWPAKRVVTPDRLEMCRREREREIEKERES